MKKSRAKRNDWSLESCNKELAGEFDPIKNGVSASEVTYSKNTHIKYWWICRNGHSYQSTFDKRKLGVGCPYCTVKNRRALAGVNDISTLCPEMMKTWDFDKNVALGLDPTKLTAGSMKKAWWKCPDCGVEWQAEIRTRAKGMMRCPNCFERSKNGKASEKYKATRTDK